MAFRSKVIKFGTAAVPGPVLTARMSNQIDYSRGHILLYVPRQLERPSKRTYRAPIEFTAHPPSAKVRPAKYRTRTPKYPMKMLRLTVKFKLRTCGLLWDLTLIFDLEV